MAMATSKAEKQAGTQSAKIAAEPPDQADINDAVLAALRSIPHAIAVFDEQDQLLFCSEEYQKQFDAVIPPGPVDPLATKIRYEDIVRGTFAAKLPAEKVDARVQVELDSHRTTYGFQRDVLADTGWRRRFRYTTDTDHVVSLAFSIDELVRKTQALDTAKRELEHQAFHDPLTDLPNRRGLNAHLRGILTEWGAARQPLALLHVDLDKFKSVNDSLGHHAGDKVLSEAADILRKSVRREDIVARVGGDEFVLVCEGFENHEDIANMAQRIVDRMQEPIPYSDEFCQIGASIGIATCPAGAPANDLVLDADIALYEAKERGRGCYAFFSPTYRERYSNLQAQVFAVRDAIQLNAFEPYFQPIMKAETGEIVGFEALPRWLHIEKGILGPENFMSAIVEAHLIEELDSMIFRKSIRAIKYWEEEHGAVLPRVSINMSSSGLVDQNAVDRIIDAAKAADLDPARLGLEVLENELEGDQLDIVVQNVQALSAAGFHISLDDFGTGRASIAGLRNLAVNRIKIDRSFVQNIHGDPDLRTITGAMISLVNSLEIEALADGVECEAERSMLLALGADLFQGPLISKPMDARTVPLWLDKYNRDMFPDTKFA